MIRKHTKKQKHPTKFLGRNYKNYNKDILHRNLDLIDWTSFIEAIDPNLMWSIYLKNITDQIDKLYPILNYNINQQKEPWINDEIMHMIIEKDRLLSQARLLNTEDAWTIAKQAKNRTKNYITRAKSNYISESLEINKQNPKTFWRTINDLLPNKKQTDSHILLKDQIDNEIISDDDVPNYINTYFTSIGPKLAENYKKPFEIIGPIGQEQFQFELLTNQQVMDEIKQINIAKPSAIYLISTKVLKDIFLYTHDKLTILFNTCITTSSFPDAWKIAMVTPLKKEGFKNNVSALRPISILPLPGKIFEKLLHTQLYYYFNNTNLLATHQGGFRPNHSTNSTIANFTDYIYTNINKNQITQSIFIDFSKAFDTVNYEILYKKLKYYLLTKNAIKIIENYLTNRKQSVQINGKTSSMLNINCGVPQGSVLGPLLFLIYINDLEMFLSNVHVSQYADDTVISYTDKNQQKINEILMENLTALAEWCEMNKLTVNVGKTKSMYFGSRNITKKIDYGKKMMLNGRELQQVDHYKYLGVILDKNMTFKLHIESILKILKYKIYVLAKLRPYLTVYASLSIYKTTILPYIDYGDIFYQAASKKMLHNLQDRQDKALKICYKLRGTQDDANMHLSANLAFLDKRRNSHILNFMYKRKENEIYLDKRDLQTRAFQAPKFIVPKYNIKLFTFSIIYKGSILWNQLPNDVKNIDTFLAFKNKTKQLSK